MAQWEYRTLMYGTADPLRRWVITAPDVLTRGQQVGGAEKGRFICRIWQGLHLLESALQELDADGWELVSVSFSGVLSFYGCAVLKRRAVT